MNILVLAIAGTEGGALSIMNNLYNEIISSDTKHTYYFAVSTVEYQENDNFILLRYPWVKKSWFHRLYFDYVYAKKIVKEYNIDEVITLQNTIVKGVNIPQYVYLHQPLPYVDKRYKLFENPKFWIYQNLISKMINKSLKVSKGVVVQGEWLKSRILKILPNKDTSDIIVNYPKINQSIIKENKMEYTDKFFYPALAYPYKNHQLIVDALKLIDKDLEYEVNFTIKKDTLPYVESIYEDVISNNLNVNFIGRTTLEETFNLYSESVLLFPSEIETFGLPLLEARLSKCIVIALNTPFAREILEGYNNAYLFDSVEEFANLINKVLKNEIIRKSDDKLNWLEHKNLLQVFEQLIDKKNTL